MRYGVSGLARDAMSSSSQGEVLSFDASDFGPGSLSTFEKSIQFINHIHLFKEQIEGPLYYHHKLLEERIQGKVHVRIIVNSDGSLRHLEHDTWIGDRVLCGWVQRVITQALNKPFLHHPMKKALELDLNFYFQIANDASLFTYGASDELNTLNFYVYEVMPPKYDVTTGQVLVTAYQAMTQDARESRKKLEEYFISKP